MDDAAYPAYLKNQSYADLLSIRDSLDQRTRPERYAMVVAEIAARDALPAPTPTVSITDVEAELGRQPSRRRTALGSAALLVLSLLLFVGTGIFRASLPSLAILVLVLFLHESGHWLGMKAFGYRDVQLFFLPFFGAAVSGKKGNASATSAAIVALLGPVPGIVLGIGSAFVYRKTHQPFFLTFGGAALFLNTFNLLPIFPLDGGRFLEAVLLARHPTVEVIFRLSAGLALALLAVVSHSVLLVILALFSLIASREAHFLGKTVRRLRRDPRNLTPSPDERIPHECLEVILPDLVASAPKQGMRARTIASRAQNVWQRFCQRPPRLGPSVALLAMYLVALVIGIVGTALILTSRDTQHGSAPMTYDAR